jgi:transcriptional regulator with XRE-family HTH domain
MNIGKRLLDLRAAKCFSQGDIEKRTGLLRCYVSRVENGHTIPSLETLRRWANALELEVYQLFYEGEGKPEPAVPGITEPVDGSDKKLLALLREVNEADRKLLLAVALKMAQRAA